MKIVKKLHWFIDLCLVVVLWFAVMMIWALAISKFDFLRFLDEQLFTNIAAALFAAMILFAYFNYLMKYNSLYLLDTLSTHPRIKIPGLELIYEKNTDVVIVKEDGASEVRISRPDLHYSCNDIESTRSVSVANNDVVTVHTAEGSKTVVILRQPTMTQWTDTTGHAIELLFKPSASSLLMPLERNLTIPGKTLWKTKVYTKTGTLEKAAFEKMNRYIGRFYKATAEDSKKWLEQYLQEDAIKP